MIKTEISKSRIESLVVLFILIQASVWYDGLINILPDFIFRRWNMIQIALTLLMMVLCFTRKKSIYKITALIIISRLLITFSTYCNGREVSLVGLCKLICIMLAFEYFEGRFEELISIWMIVFEVMIYYNFVLAVQTGPDLYGAFYSALGYDNGWSPYLLMAYLISWIYYKIKGKWLRPLLLVITIHFTLFYVMVGTGIVAIILVDILLLIRFIVKFDVTLLRTYLIYMGINTSIVFFRVQNIFSFFIVDILGKDLTFTGRTRDWDNAIAIIPKKIFLGHGNMDQQTELRILGDVFTHNAFLEQLFRGGIIYVVFFVLIIYLVSQNVNIRRNACVNSAICIVSGFWVLALTEVIFDSLMFFCAIILLYHLGNYEKTKELGYYNRE